MINKFFLLLTVTFLSLNLVQNSAFAQQEGFVWITELNYNSVKPFSEGLAAVYDGKVWGYIDHFGELTIQPEFSSAKKFIEDRAIVTKDGKYGVIDKMGNLIVDFEFDFINNYSCEFALATKGDAQYYISKSGEIKTLTPKYKFSDFHEGLAIIKRKNLFGYIDTTGRVVVEPKYISCDHFSQGRAFVVSRLGKLFVDKKGKIIGKILVKNIVPPFCNGLAQTVSFGNWGLTDGEKTIIQTKYDGIRSMSEGFIPIKENNQWGFVGLNKSTISPRYAEVGDFHSGLAFVRTINKFGYIDTNGTLVIDDVFNSATDMDEGYAVVEINKRKGIVKLLDYKDQTKSILVSRIKVNDDIRDGLIEENEKFTLEFHIQNNGEATVKNVVIKPEIPFESQTLLSYDQITEIGDISPSETKIIKLEMSSAEDIDSREVDITLNFSASNLFNSTTAKTSIETIGTESAKTILKSYWFHNQDFDEIYPGDSITATVWLQNIGAGIASEVSCNIGWPGYLRNNPKENFVANRLMPMEEIAFSTTFQIDTACTKDEISVYTAITSNKMISQQENKYINIFLGEVNTKQSTYAQEQYSKPIVTTKTEPVIAKIKKPEGADDDELIAPIINSFTSVPLKLNKFALIIGNENYQSQKAQNDIDVAYAHNDADAFSFYAERVFGVPKSNIIVLKDATKAKINQSIDKMVRISKSLNNSAELLVYYAGHAQNDADTELTYLIPVDISLTNAKDGIPIGELYASLGDSEAQKINVFLDACYSGVSRGIVVNKKEETIPGNILSITSCSANQTSMPYHEKEHGMFTYFLLKAIADHQGNIAYSDLFNSVKTNVFQKSIWINSMEQTPQLIIGDALEDSWGNWNVTE